ncbi:HAD-IA family hydrolase [Actibacterium lipolyticum]|uniref:Pyrophosphatase PpaX n=1 Tax=Actibacterium lipolyticum TaxID=1524263 RepID=A0A238JJY4_9RHOB|nr:HAD-IA family hydrolase [Actibacterium lipolyticum]SMX30988.1 Pyrophosphatase PpaX [Actibacterium lipolyticum]
MSALRLVIFDVDGTLVDSQGHIKAAMETAFQAENLTPPAPEAVLGIVGLSLNVAIAQLAPELDEKAVGRIVEAYKGSFSTMRAADMPSPLYPGALDVLEGLAQNDDVLMGVATGKSRRGLDHILDAHGLKRFFVTEQVADHHPSKPHPSMVQAALAETGVSARDAVMIGDTSFDMDMGRAAGVGTVGVGWGYHGVERLTAADHVIDEFQALPGTLERIWSV